MATRRRTSLRIRVIRATDGIFDLLGMRPLGIAVFAASAFALMQMIGASEHSIRAHAVAMAERVEHPSRVSSFVTSVFVKPGDRVQVGTPLVELSSYFVNQKLARIDAEVDRLITESKLEQARLVVDEQRWVQPNLRIRPNQPSLNAPTEAFYAKQLEELTVEREALLQGVEALVVQSDFAGVVAEVARLGASIAEGASVASIMPEFAQEIVAYIPPMKDAKVFAIDANAYIVGADTPECESPGLIRRRGAAVIQAPEQLTSFFRPLHGTPIHISLPEACLLGNGQVLMVEIEDGSKT